MGTVKLLAALVAVTGVILTAARADADSLVTNGDLERLGPDRFPADWERVGEQVGIASDAHSGRVAFRLVRKADTAAPETGVNRAWQPDSGLQGAMLDRLKGGIVFWYKAISQARPRTLTVQIIPMSARPMEDTGSERVVFHVPESEVGDGRWHRGALKYDFTANPKVKWVHISPRLLGPGELLLDDFEWVEKVGPIVRIRYVTFTEGADAPGREASLEVEIGNRGDAPAAPDILTAEAPPGVSVEPADCPVPALDPDQTYTVSLTLRGARYEAGVVRLWLASAPLPVSVPIAASAALERVIVERFILAPGEQTTLRATVLNDGRTILRAVSLTARGGVRVAEPCRQQIQELPPGQKATVEWSISPLAQEAQPWVEVSARLPGGATSKRVSLVALCRGEEVTLSDGQRTLAVARTRLGYGLGELRARAGREEVVLARMSNLGRVVFRTPGGQRVERSLFAQRVRRTARDLACAGNFADPEGAKWRFTATFRLTARGRFALRYSLQVDEPRELLAFDGPMIYAAEGSQANRLDGVFPGLEWLVEGEESSSDLDLAADHPDRVRYVPHPNKVTIPLMSLRTEDGLVALLWDPHQKWDGERDRPAAVFASPARFEGRASHLMGLMLPSVPDFIAENEREAQRPYPMQPGRALTLTALLVVAPEARDALVAQDVWIEEFGLPDPLPYPRGTLEQEIAFSARAYLDSLWLPDQRKWLPYKGGPAIWNTPSRNPGYAYDLTLASLLAADAETRQACLERLDLLRAEGPLIASADDLGFDYGRAEQGLSWLISTAVGRLDAQRADGSWRFDADLQDQGVFKGFDYHELGPDDAAEVGTCARAAYEILLAARMTGDEQAYQAGVRALRFMERFTVPRAAQVWEVPVHTPDILAAADAVDAYLEAYRIDKDSHWLQQAVEWARRGLPFLYLWNTPEHPFMRYASIPVFGASWLKWSWIGRAVQWNGLRYAYALLKLSEYDATLPWRRIAEGITVSAMYQQATEPPEVALWPDSISLIDASKSGWIFAPRQILKNVYHLLGRPEEPQTAIVPTPAGPVHINSGARILNPTFAAGELSCTLTYPAHRSGTTAIVGISAPQAVMVDDTPVPPAADSLAAPGPAYSYLPALSLLCLRITQDGAHQVRITGVSAQPATFLPEPRSQIAFDFDASAEGWQPANDLAPFQVRDGLLLTKATGGDPYMTRSRMSLDGDAIRAVAVRMALTGGERAQFYWATADAPFFSEERVVNFEINADGEFREYRIDVGQHPQWRGRTITAIRLDPTGASPDAKIEIDWIRSE